MDTIGWLIHTLESRSAPEDGPEPPCRPRPTGLGLLERLRAAARRPLPR